MVKFITILKQISKFVCLHKSNKSMKSLCSKYFFISILTTLLSYTSIKAQSCYSNEWLYENRELGSYIIDNGDIFLYYCENTTDETISAPAGYIDVIWQYDYDIGNDLGCEDWDYNDETFFFSINSEDPCYQEISEIEVVFEGIVGPDGPDGIPDTSDDEEAGKIHTCPFTIILNQIGEPFIEIDNYNTDEQIIICEDDNITLTAAGLGSLPNDTDFEWYLNGEKIDNQNSIELMINSTNYDINKPNTFYFKASNYCSDLTDSQISSDWLTITIYEGYENCEPCAWEFPNFENNEFFGFCIDCEGDGYFPEKPNNEENRSIENSRIPTCEATIYKLFIYNRIGRKIFESKHNNEPWNGKLENGKKCKEGTYFYKIEYTLNPHLPDDDLEQNKPKVRTGSVYLAWGN